MTAAGEPGTSIVDAVGGVALELERRLVAQAERRLVERVLQERADEEHARLAVDARVEIAAGRRLACRLQPLHRPASPATLKLTAIRAGSRPNSAEIAGFSTDHALDFERIERAEQRAHFRRSRSAAARASRFPRGR